jgi:hypothetical protein
VSVAAALARVPTGPDDPSRRSHDRLEPSRRGTANSYEDPGDYLLRAALAAIDHPGTVTLPKTLD